MSGQSTASAPLYTPEELEAARKIVNSAASQQVMGPLAAKDISSSLKTQVPKLSDGKFHFWRNRMETILEDHGLLTYVESDIPQPSDPIPSATWRRAMNSAKSLIKMGLSDQQLLPLMHLDTPSSMWKTLIESQISDASTVTMTLMKKLTTFRMDTGKSMTVNINAVRDILVQLKAVHESVPENLVKSIVLTSLPEGYESFQTTMESVMFRADSPMNLESLFTRILAREASMKAQVTVNDSALFTGEKRGFKKPSHRPKTRSAPGAAHSAEPSEKGKKSKVPLHDKFPCHKCKQLGHWKHNCPLNSPSQSEDANVHEEEDEESAFVTTNVPSKSSGVWFLDTAATMHMTYQLELLSNYRDIAPVAIRLGNDHLVHAVGEGQAILTFHSDEDIPPFILKKVWFVPELSKNLFATHMLSPSLETRIHSSGFDIVDPSGTRVLCGEKVGKLLLLGPLECSAFTEECNLSETVLWHKRFGHISSPALHKMKSSQTVKGLHSANLSSRPIPCEVCVSGKQSKHSYTENTEVRTKAPLQIVYSDLYGPLPTPSHSGKRYILTFVDDFSRYTWIYFLTKKSEALSCFQKFVLFVAKQYDYPFKQLFSDNGGEYTSKKFKTFCDSQGIRHLYSAPYASQQNGIAERLNRTMAEKARCMLLEAQLDQRFWAEAFATAIYLKNRSSTRSLPACVTPYEILEGKTPTVHHLKVFGCLAYKFVHTRSRNKLDSKSDKLIFLGYEETGNYRLWNPATEKISISKDVKFFETHLGVHSFPSLPPDTEDTEYVPVLQPDPLPLPATTPVPPSPIDALPAAEPAPEQISPILEDQVQDGDEESVPESVPDSLPTGLITRSGRSVVPPRHFEDFAMINECNSDSDDELAFFAGPCDITEPATYAEAISGPHQQDWIHAIHEELHSHSVNGTWELVTLPANRKPIGSKWTFKVKRTKDGLLERFKARLVAQGFSQRQGIDFHETFAPVAKLDSIRILLAQATIHDWEIHHLDVKTAFLYGSLEEEVYMRVPEGGIPDCDTAGKVCHLLKSIYGLKQASRVWYQELDKKLTSIGFCRTYMDSSVYTLYDTGSFLYLAVWVDDIILVGPSLELIMSVKTHLFKSFQMSDLGEISYLLGIDITRDRGSRVMTLHQGLYLNHILNRFKMENAHPCATPMEVKTTPELFSAPSDPAEIASMRTIPYSQLIGSLMYAMLGTRPDLAHSVSFLSQFLVSPGAKHWSAAKRVLRFLKKTKSYRLTYSVDGNKDIVSYSDSDWGGDLGSRRSTSGYVFILGGGAITWKSRKQSTVALSSTEAEYMAVAMATSEALWIRNFMFELSSQSVPVPPPIQIFCDNQGCVFVTKNLKEHSRLKHIDLRFMFVRDAVDKKKVSITHCSTNVMAADIFTKPLPKDKFYRCLTLFGLIEDSSS